ncbi:MAG: YdeI/OmpD-associated family protein [Bacteroidales bacterium]|nr:YdeI/OmpD-associated family protein [Bacteroidales bacterium]
MSNNQQIHFKNREEFRIWLNENFNKSDGIWMLYYKKHTQTENISYDEAVEEAICFGWIDSIVKRIDEETYLRKFTPRYNFKNWSDTNKLRAIKMIKLGRMTDAGLKKIDTEQDEQKLNVDKEKAKTFEIPDYIINEFGENQPALENFQNLSLSCKKEYIGWIISAKRPETLKKRINKTIELLKENKKLGLM